MKMIELLNEEIQQRVFHGSEAQQIIEQQLSDEFGDDYELISIAPPSSKKPDLVARIEDEVVQFEIKGRADTNSLIKFYEKSVGRGQRDRVLDSIANILSDGQAHDFTNFMDLLRKTNKHYGFPGDKGVVKSGSIYLNVTDRAHLSKIRTYLINTLRADGNNYFVAYNRKSHDVSYFHTGQGSNALNVPRIPNINQIVIDTYGGQYKGKMRVAIKVRLAS